MKVVKALQSSDKLNSFGEPASVKRGGHRLYSAAALFLVLMRFSLPHAVCSRMSCLHCSGFCDCRGHCHL